jgi:hypothetical protein
MVHWWVCWFSVAEMDDHCLSMHEGDFIYWHKMGLYVPQRKKKWEND